MRYERVRAFAGRLLAVTVLLLASAEGAHADIYSTFGDGDSYNASQSWSVVEGWPKGFSFSVTGTESYALDNIQLEMAVSLFEGDNVLEVSIMTADAEGEPGTVLGTFSFDGELDSDPAILTGASVSVVEGAVLDAGQTYWLVASAPVNTEVAWYLSDPAVSGQIAFYVDGSWEVYDGETLSAFRLSEVSAVPLPGAVLLGAMGLSYSGWRLRRRAA